jgi:hypothetical protein
MTLFQEVDRQFFVEGANPETRVTFNGDHTGQVVENMKRQPDGWNQKLRHDRKVRGEAG